MDLDHTDINTFPLWEELSSVKIKQSYKKSLDFGSIKLNVLHNHINDVVLEKISELVTLTGLGEARTRWLDGSNQNYLPDYIYLRHFPSSSLGLKLDAVKYDEVVSSRNQIKEISEKINQNRWLGYSNKIITNIVNIGIGGSDLGPKFYYEALKSFQINEQLNCYFISDSDYYSIQDRLKNLNPETTLFIVASKSFNTEETLMNAQFAREWINHPCAFAKHFIAVTANIEKAKSLGFQNIVGIGKWVVGRYSISSAINLINAIMLGFDNYLEFLKGAEEMDYHFFTADWKNNLPLILALIGIWNINFLHIPTQLMLLYHSKLKYFCDYVQQLDMESNGKSFDKNGQKVSYATAPIVWGGLGNQSQHSYYQFLAQGSSQVAIDFLSVQDINNNYLSHLCLKRQSSLFYGLISPEESIIIKQQSSINHIELTELSPRSIGSLIALYEHKIFSQAWIWNINPFDQPGVEVAKTLADKKIAEIL